MADSRNDSNPTPLTSPAGQLTAPPTDTPPPPCQPAAGTCLPSPPPGWGHAMGSQNKCVSVKDSATP